MCSQVRSRWHLSWFVLQFCPVAAIHIREELHRKKYCEKNPTLILPNLFESARLQLYAIGRQWISERRRECASSHWNKRREDPDLQNSIYWSGEEIWNEGRSKLWIYHSLGRAIKCRTNHCCLLKWRNFDFRFDRELELIEKTLLENKGNRQKVATLLGVSERTLRYKLAKMREEGYTV